MSEGAELLISLIPFMVLSIPIAIVNYFLARRLGKSPALWLILSLIPLFNVYFWWYALYATAFTILNRLDKISARVGA